MALPFLSESKTAMPQKGLKRGLRGAGRKKENVPQKFSSFFPARKHLLTNPSWEQRVKKGCCQPFLRFCSSPGGKSGKGFLI
jgi:hypothetical protein